METGNIAGSLTDSPGVTLGNLHEKGLETMLNEFIKVTHGIK